MRDTQIDAWESIQDKLPESRSKVLSLIRSADGGATLFELVGWLGWPINRISGRVTELARDSLICDSGYRRVNPISGRPNIVWVPEANPQYTETPFTNTTDSSEADMNSLLAAIARIGPNSIIKMYGWQAKRLLSEAKDHKR